MAASKMAVRNKSKPDRLRVELKLPDKGRALIRVLSVVFLIAGIGFIGLKGVEEWQQVWPVQQITLQGNYRYLQQKDIVEFMQQQPEKGMLAIDLRYLQSKVKDIDWIDAVEVRKIWPDQLVFKVDEHSPVARFGNHLLTRKGTLIKYDNGIDELINLPEIKLAKNEQIAQKNYVSIWHEFKKMKREFEVVNLRLEGLRIDQLNNWRLKFQSGLQLNLGRKEHVQRVSRLINVYPFIKNKKQIRKIDLRYRNGLAVDWLNKVEQKQTNVRLGDDLRLGKFDKSEWLVKQKSQLVG